MIDKKIFSIDESIVHLHCWSLYCRRKHQTNQCSRSQYQMTEQQKLTEDFDVVRNSRMLFKQVEGCTRYLLVTFLRYVADGLVQNRSVLSTIKFIKSPPHPHPHPTQNRTKQKKCINIGSTIRWALFVLSSIWIHHSHLHSNLIFFSKMFINKTNNEYTTFQLQTTKWIFIRSNRLSTTRPLLSPLLNMIAVSTISLFFILIRFIVLWHLSWVTTVDDISRNFFHALFRRYWLSIHVVLFSIEFVVQFSLDENYLIGKIDIFVKFIHRIVIQRPMNKKKLLNICLFRSPRFAFGFKINEHDMESIESSSFL